MIVLEKKDVAVRQHQSVFKKDFRTTKTQQHQKHKNTLNFKQVSIN